MIMVGISLSFPSSVSAQPGKILFDHYTTADGLANNTIWKICKSRKGFIWLGTQDGLCRFDGKNFKTYRYAANNSNSISNNTVYEVLEDDIGYIWAGTFSGLNRYNPGTNSFARINNGAYLTSKGGNVGIGALGQSPSGKLIWVGTRGLFFVNPKTLSLAPAPGNLNKDIFDGGGNIFSLLVESDEKIWIGSDRGLIIYNFKDSSYQLFNTNQKMLLPGKTDYQIKGMLLDNKGKLWIANWGLGLLEFDTSQKKFTGQYLFEKSDGFKGGTNIICSLAQTNFPGQEDIISLACFGTSFTAFNMQTKTFTSYKSEISNSRNGVYGAAYSLFFSNSDGLWIGSEKGLCRYDLRMQVFDEHKFVYDFRSACITQVFEAYPDPLDSSGNTIWIGTWSCGLFKYNLSSQSFTEMPGWVLQKLREGIPYHAILRDTKGIVWVGSSRDGLIAIDEKKKTVTRYYPPDNNPSSVSHITFLMEDELGRLWTGTPDGLYILDADRKKFDQLKWRIDESTRKKLSRGINGLCMDKNGNTWFTVQDGYNEKLPVIGMVKKGELEAALFFNQLSDKSSFPDVKVVQNIICDNNNTLWCASWNGLISWKAADKKSYFKIYTTEDGLLNNFINRVETDAAGNIWCGTTAGLSVLMNGNKKFRNLKNAGLEQDNVDGIFYNRRQGCMMIAGEGKIHTIKTGDLMVEASPPKVTITDFRVFNKPAPEVDKYIFDSSNISLASNRNVVTIDFAALTFYNPSQVQYAYRMKGVDNDWIFTSNNSVSYNLGNGQYVFQVKAMNAEGVWNEEGVFMRITILAPFWKQAWFIALVTFVIAAVLYSIYRYRINQVKKVQAIRNNISQNLHDDIGSSLSNINILNELAKRNATNPDKSKEYLEKSGEDIQRISESLSDIVWNINPRYDDLQNLFIRMKRYAADMMDGKNISYQLEFPEEAERISLPMEKRRDMYLIFKEAVNNLVKYSKATEASIKVFADKKKIVVEVKDNGIGFDTAKANTGNGITNMRQRAASCGAELEIISGPGGGTAIKLEMTTT